MKRILIIVCLLFTANSWADDEEFPIELTCELGNMIVYFNITDNLETTWWQNHSSNTHYEEIQKNIWSYKNRNQANELEINKDNIYLYTKLIIRAPEYRKAHKYVLINRLTGAATITYKNTPLAGHCTKGFKNYEKNVF